MTTPLSARGKRHCALFVVIAVCGCLLDLATKFWVFEWRGMPFVQSAYWLIPDVFGIETSLNEGALAGIGQGRTWFFASLSTIAAAGIIWWVFFGGAAEDIWLTIALGGITAGICGNLYDRLGMPGLTWHLPTLVHQVGDPVYAVRDWLHFKLDNLHFDWPIFNIADSFLVVGGILLAWHAYRGTSTMDTPSK